MAVGVLASLSEDQAMRIALSLRRDEMTNYYAMRQRSEEYRHRAEESERRAIKAMRDKNWTISDIAAALELPEEQVERFY